MSDFGAEVQTLEFSRYAAVLRRRWRVIVAALLAGLVLGGLFLLIAPRSATATTVVTINVITDDAFGGDRAPSMMVDPQTEQQLGRSTSALSNAIERMDTDSSLAEVRRRTQIFVVPASTVVRISYAAPSEKEAIAGADIIADSYLEFREALAQQRVESRLEPLHERRDELRDDLVDARTRLNGAEKGSPAAARAASDIELINLELAGLINRMNEFDKVDTMGGNVISPAADSVIEYNPSRKVVLGGGLLVGLVLGIALAFIVHGRDRRVFDRGAVTRAGGGLVLAELRGRDATIPAAGSDANDLRALCDQLLATYPPDLVLAVFDLASDTRASDVGVNLADAFADLGRTVHLIVPGADEAFVAHISDRLGLDLSAESNATSTVRSVKRHRLHVTITSADIGDPASPTEGVADLVKAVAGAVVVIALPPDPPRSWRLAAARASLATLLVVALRGTRYADIVGVASDLWAVDARVYGTVLVPSSRRITTASGAPLAVAPPRPVGRAPAAPGQRGTSSASVGAETLGD